MKSQRMSDEGVTSSRQASRGERQTNSRGSAERTTVRADRAHDRRQLEA